MELKKNSIKVWSRAGARAVYGMAIMELAKEKSDFYVVTADLDVSSGLARFVKDYPDRFINFCIS